MAFARLEALPRRAAEHASEGLWTAIGHILDALSLAVCRTYFGTPEMIQADRIALQSWACDFHGPCTA